MTHAQLAVLGFDAIIALVFIDVLIAVWVAPYEDRHLVLPIAIGLVLLELFIAAVFLP